MALGPAAGGFRRYGVSLIGMPLVREVSHEFIRAGRIVRGLAE